MKICPMGAEFVPCGRTDGHDEANSRFANAPKNNEACTKGIRTQLADNIF
jgi:hypothetical protein